MRRLLAALALAALAACSTASGPHDAAPGPAPGASRDVVWDVVSTCLVPSVASYCERCRWPLAGTCAPDRPCRAMTEVWARTADYVAIRDLKMCGCAGDFVHGLAVPLAHVTGVEDPRRPAGIWRFAWDAARAKIGDDAEIALVVNPTAERGQDQLHVHLVRLAPEARPGLAALSPEHVARLDDVWDAATRHAGGRTDEGILVARDADGTYLVVTSMSSLEDRFTIARCPAAR